MNSDEYELRRLLQELTPYAADIMLIGGWVPTLYARYGPAGAWKTRPSRTQELDVAIPHTGILAAERPLLVHVLKAAGLTPSEESSTASDGSAVWTGATETGAMIEFLMPHQGPLRGNAPTAVKGQPGLMAVPLIGLDLLWRAPRWIEISNTPLLRVQVPALGMYLLNKAVTFPYRQPRRGELVNPKQGKDLVYLHDCAMAGEAVVRSIMADITMGCSSDADLPNGSPTVGQAIDKTISNLELALSGNFQRGWEQAVEQLSERERMEKVTADATLRGALTDLCDILQPLRSPTEPHQDDGLW
jgi:hypothetical protein